MAGLRGVVRASLIIAESVAIYVKKKKVSGDLSTTRGRFNAKIRLRDELSPNLIPAPRAPLPARAPRRCLSFPHSKEKVRTP